MSDGTGGLRATTSSIAPSLQSFDDVTEMEWIVHPLGKPPAIIGIDTESTVSLRKCVAGRAGRWTRWRAACVHVGARNDLRPIWSPEMKCTIEIAGDGETSSVHDAVMETT